MTEPEPEPEQLGGPRPTRRTLLKGAGLASAAVVLSGGAATAVEVSDQDERRHLAATNSQLVEGGDPARSARVLWSVGTEERVVALTFDDGPDPELTPRVLDVLAKAGATATFLVVGERARVHPDLVRAAVAGGHEVGSHSMVHRDPVRMSERATGRDAADAAAILRDLTGRPARWFRPPWGRLTGSGLRAAAELGHDVLLWSTSAHGLGSAPTELAASFPSRLKPGRVALLHDGVARGAGGLPFTGRPSTAELLARRRAEIAALPEVLARSADLGFRFVMASELAAMEPMP